jgi:predicted nucleic acid-binding Zn finger protein
MQTKKAKKWRAGKRPDYDALLASAGEKIEAERMKETAQAASKATPERKAAIAAEAERLASPARKEAERLKEQAAKLPLPPLQGEGKYEARVVQALVEILTGRPTQIRLQKIEMPETIFEKIVLVLSSTEQFYYRVTEQGGCTCKGWHFSLQRYGIGKCRHYYIAFPEQAAQNMARIDAMKAKRTGQVARKATASSSDPGEPLMSDDEKAGFRPFLEF